jgi:formylglycine-generating enzyme
MLRADTFGSGINTFTIDFVTIGDLGNPADTGTTGMFSSPYGGVNYTYRMGTYEVSEDMVDKANTLGGLLIAKDTRSANQPATSVSWNEAARFVNWLNVSSGYTPAYKFALQPGNPAYTGNENLVLWSPSDVGYDASNLYRNGNAHYFLPSEDEWYKAAFYSGSGNVYYDYATGSDVIPTAVASGTAAGTAVYGSVAGTPATIMQAGGMSHYGTVGQSGNARERLESAFAAPNDSPTEDRGFRGGFWTSSEDFLRSSYREGFQPTSSGGNGIQGMRIASVPEPSVALLLLGAGAMLVKRRRRTP